MMLVRLRMVREPRISVLAVRRHQLDAVPLEGERLVVGAVAVVALAAVHLADAEEQRHAAPRLRGGRVGPREAVAAGSGAGIVGDAVEGVRLARAVLALQPEHLDLPLGDRRRAG